MRRLLLSNRGVRVLVAHSALIVLANYLAFWLRFDGTIPDGYWALWLDTIPWLVVLRGLTFVPFHIYEGVWRYVGIRDLRAILGGVFSSTVVFYVLIHGLLGLSNYPRSVFLVDSVFLVFLVGGIRVGWRFYREYQPGGKGTRVLIFGAGDAGQAIAREIHAGGQHGYLPVGFVDDDRAKAGQRIHGVPVLGTRNDLPRIIAEARPSEVLVAIPRATPGVLRAVVKALEPYKLPIKALPHLRDILDGRVTLNDVRRLEVADLLGRAPVGLDPQNVSHLVEGKRVLVTGAGGSIGSELSRQVAALRPSSLVLLERYENALWALERSLAGAQAGVDVYPIIGDVTDEGRIDEVLRERRPQVILHAAAHKHVPLMELNPCEAIKNNVKGTRIVGEAAVRHGVDRFVLISTDKAVNPSSVMGATKCVAELLTMRLAERASTCFMVVRFGNVMGSNGSVIPLFLEQIKNGGPVTITHPDMRRYFMLIPEAVQLVLQAAALGDNGAAYVLDMGDEIRVLDIARNLIRLSGFIPEREIPITFIGPRPGEKLSEELVASGETVEPSGIQGIRRVRASANPTCATLEQDVAELERLAELGGAGSVIQQLCALVPTFRPSVERDLDMAPSQPALPASPTGAAATLIGEIRGFA
ncbi:MAG TPA: nucleoside-diphosphate sugar epimerase/dehydratase [Methylomirabilota bacterium]|nr:nucleoside-diphosphate sugar epimerase/dehydratase [Methylomirabilota bacterium]